MGGVRRTPRGRSRAWRGMADRPKARRHNPRIPEYDIEAASFGKERGDSCTYSQSWLLFHPPVSILKSHDVILTKIAAGLDLDDFQRDRAGIGEAMSFPQWDISTLIFG